MKNALLTILIFFWKLITIFPIKFQNAMSFFIGRLILKSSFKRNKYSRVNIDLCFPNLSFEKRSEIYKNNVLSFWPYLAPESCISFRKNFFIDFKKIIY